MGLRGCGGGGGVERMWRGGGVERMWERVVGLRGCGGGSVKEEVCSDEVVLGGCDKGEEEMSADIAGRR